MIVLLHFRLAHYQRNHENDEDEGLPNAAGKAQNVKCCVHASTNHVDGVVFFYSYPFSCSSVSACSFPFSCSSVSACSFPFCFCSIGYCYSY
jgi:hypothetical protein